MRTPLGAFALFVSAVIGLASSTVALSAPVTMTFEGLGDFEYVREYYNGGYGGSGSGPGPTFGVSFPDGTYSSIDADDGGTGNFGGEPSGNTAVSFQQFGAWMNVSAGFSDGLSFYYSNPNGPNSIFIYDGIDGAGNLLATLFLPMTAYQGQMDPTGNLSPLVYASVTFSGTARSVDFQQLAHRAYVDDIRLGAPVPVPAGSVLLGSALAAFATIRRKAVSQTAGWG